MIKEAADYLGKNAKSFEEVRMAIAGLEAVHGTSPDFARWNEQLQGMRNPDGTWGEGPGQAYATGGAGAAVLRMGLKLDKRDAVIAALKAGQRPEGGWSKDAGPPDLGATYRIMRALYMLHERPDIDRLLAFIARCRQSDGSYASKPGGAGEPGRNVHRHDRDLLGAPAPGHTGRRRDRRFHSAGQRQGPGRLGRRHASSGRTRTASWSATRRGSITTSSCRRPRPMATSSSRSTSG